MMPTRPLVAISQRVDVWSDRGEKRDALDQRLIELVMTAGVLPLPVPNPLGLADGTMDAWLIATRPRGIILSGGNDVGEYPERDRVESELIRYAEANLLPLLGICRGMQMLACWAGVELAPVQGHVRTRHSMQAAEEAELWPRQVNSYHDYVVKSCPPGFTVAGRAENGDIEALRHLSLPWEAWMWHPEREPKFSAVDLARLKLLFSL